MLNTESFEYPRNSSDYVLDIRRDDDPSAPRIAAVLDTIGRPANRAIGKAPRHIESVFRETLGGAQCLRDARTAFSDAVVDINGYLADMNGGREPIFGFCMCCCLVDENEFLLHSLGDCRAYAFSRVRDAESDTLRTAVQCLTRDDNQLDRMLEAQQETTLFRNELLELSRQLSAHWGMPDRETVRGLIEAQQTVRPLNPGDMLWLTTDGFYLPLLRSIVENQYFHISYDLFYLESWIAERLRENEKASGAAEAAGWKETLNALREQSVSYAQDRRRYADDLACMQIVRAC